MSIFLQVKNIVYHVLSAVYTVFSEGRIPGAWPGPPSDPVGRQRRQQRRLRQQPRLRLTPTPVLTAAKVTALCRHLLPHTLPDRPQWAWVTTHHRQPHVKLFFSGVVAVNLSHLTASGRWVEGAPPPVGAVQRLAGQHSLDSSSWEPPSSPLPFLFRPTFMRATLVASQFIPPSAVSAARPGSPTLFWIKEDNRDVQPPVSPFPPHPSTF